MAWDIELTQNAEDWYMNLDARDADRVAAAIDEVQRQGPRLGRPFVDSIKGSRHHNMKELRSVGGNLRVLFAFDRQRRAILLVGGDKTDNWRGWYERNIPVADRLYDDHQRSLGKKEPWQTPRAGRQYAGRDR